MISEILSKPLSSFYQEDENGFVSISPCWAIKKRDERVGFLLRTPLISSEIYNKIVSLFKKVAQIYNSECLARIYWDIEQNKYCLVIPYQQVSMVSVVPVHQEYDDWLLTHIPVLEVHSHGIAYEPFWSYIDDVDELPRHGLFGVFSFCKGINEKENALYRVCSGRDEYYRISKDHLFEDEPFTYDSSFVKSILEQGRIII